MRLKDWQQAFNSTYREVSFEIVYDILNDWQKDRNELIEELNASRKAKVIIYTEKQELQRIFDNFVEAFNAKVTR